MAETTGFIEKRNGVFSIEEKKTHPGDIGENMGLGQEIDMLQAIDIMGSVLEKFSLTSQERIVI